MIRKFPKLAEMDYVGVATYGGFVDIRALGTGKSWGESAYGTYITRGTHRYIHGQTSNRTTPY